MEFAIFPRNVFLKKFFNYRIDYSYVLDGIVLLLLLVILVCSWVVLYPKIRRKFPVRVNCWFCCNYTKVPYELSNSWNCPHCTQYNGFNQDGDYNKIIKEQYNSKLNESVYSSFVKSNGKSPESYSNGFCKLCNINQHLKIQQLALFVPLNEENFDEEVEEYRQKLESAYKLCSNCEKVVRGTLEKQEYKFLQTQLNSQEKKPFELNKAQVFGKKFTAGIRWLSLAISIVLLLALIVQFETENRFVQLKLPYFAISKRSQTLLQVVLTYVKDVYKYGREISFVGFLAFLLLNTVSPDKRNSLSLLAWGFAHGSLWSSSVLLQIVACLGTIALNEQIGQTKRIHLSKRSLPQKFIFQPEKRLFTTDSSDTSGSDVSGLFSPVATEPPRSPRPGRTLLTADNPTLDGSAKCPPESLNEALKKQFRRRVGKVESLPGDCLDRMAESTTTTATPLPAGGTQKTTTTTSSAFSKSFLASLDADEREGEQEDYRETSPVSQVNSHMSGLSLGRRGKKDRKPANFLFESVKYPEKKPSPPSIIKPAKFIKNLSNSWTCPESNESISRSSTPSSGYSSQKLDQNRFEFSKTLSPITVNAFPPRRDCCVGAGGPVGPGSPGPGSTHTDFYDPQPRNRFYNFNCYPGSEYSPFQAAFPSPHVGHTTVYTYTRPAGFPGYPGFPHPVGFPGLVPGGPGTPSPLSPRLSDVSDSENLFQNASKSFETSRRWFKLKTASYYLSIFLNCLTLFVLVYFLSSGVISVEWNLPRINFFM